MFKNLLGGMDKGQLKELIDTGAYLVDVRSPGEFASGSVKGAVNIPLERIDSQLSKFKGKKSIIVFCRSGNRSGQAKMILEQSGIQNVHNGGTWHNVASVAGN
ncbi:rhodanese-like domain-containing protein [Belliella kenyensis]|uniref:Rhodanese-like domain-containing protein n=1 Tax=Belliella kenyensis TaxID=1472724 RepID=A0ABV8EKM3_9BACT|nr:rhodanese-like domain-containing protein [Belliella kenyensis]MCH7400464.1 rhodanese-like domain-containing protein [Belliella kenyensis]MDN3604520.1 rhodanese-like domain-containing protein [Belliella kenyensis]